MMDKYFIAASIVVVLCCLTLVFSIRHINEDKFITQLEYYTARNKKLELEREGDASDPTSNNTSNLNNLISEAKESNHSQNLLSLHNLENHSYKLDPKPTPVPLQGALVKSVTEKQDNDLTGLYPPGVHHPMPIASNNNLNNLNLPHLRVFDSIQPWPVLTTNPADTTLMFIHIPKTAGTTFRKDLLSINTPYSSFWYPPKGSNSWNSPGCMLQKSFGATHCSYSELNNCYNNNFMNSYVNPSQNNVNKWISIVRDPVMRVISEYYFWRKTVCNRPIGEPHCWSNELCSVKDDLSAWIKSPYNSAHNKFVKTLNNFENLKAPLDSIYHCMNVNGRKDNRFIQNNFQSYDNFNKNETVLLDAIKNIEENFAFIGNLDDIEGSGRVARYVLQEKSTTDSADPITFDLEKESSHVHTSNVRPDGVLEEHLRMIEERNYLDLQLYKYLSRKLELTIEVNQLG